MWFEEKMQGKVEDSCILPIFDCPNRKNDQAYPECFLKTTLSCLCFSLKQ